MKKRIFLILIFFFGVLFAGYQWGYNAASYQGQNGKFWNSMFTATSENLHNANQRLTKVDAQNASLSDQLNTLKALPTPTPEIRYQTITKTQTQYVGAPEQTIYNSTPKSISLPVTYRQGVVGSELYGSNGSTCTPVNEPGPMGNVLRCMGGN